ncbi:LysE family translocator [Roseibium sp. HPY-6]|uniref:LysE family translocator n=1 Tax=Roseibium sp. HPY-6 TaxID=3229852 RepID=UPI00338FDF8B
MNADLTSLLLALGIFAVGFVSIGPNILAIIGTSMERGRVAGAKLALGVGLGSGIWATLTVAGLTALIAAYAHAITILKVLGALYLLWLAYKALRSAASPGANLAAKPASGHRLMLQGLAIQMTNPKAALHWIAIVGIGLGPDAPLWVGLALIASCTLMSVLGHLAYAVTFSTQPVVDFYRRKRRWIETGLGVFFSFAAYKLATYRV